MQDVSPDLFLDRLLGFQETAALKAAVRLGFFDALAEAPASARVIGEKIGAAERGARILADFLTLKGFLSKQGEIYELTPSSRVFLTSQSPAYMASVVEFLAGDDLIRNFLTEPEDMVRRGGASGTGSLEPEHPMWVTFAKAMAPFIAPVAGAVAQQVASWPEPPKRVLDIAAGHGLFGIALGMLADDVRVTGIDWPSVLRVAKENAAAAGLADRYQELPGDALQVNWGAGYDVVLLPNFLHHFDEETCVALLKKARGSLGAGGKVLVVEFVPNEDRISPPFPARFAFMMLGGTPSGDAYTASQFEKMREAAGFTSLVIQPLPPTAQSLLTFDG